MRLSLIGGKTDTVILGNSREALNMALYLCGEGKSVAIVTPDTFLCTEGEARTDTHCVPDVRKKAAEEDCEKNGIGLFYFLWPVDVISCGKDRILRAASKGGLFGILCDDVLDFREAPNAYRCAAWLYRDESFLRFDAGSGSDPMDAGTVAQSLRDSRRELLRRWKEQREDYPGYRLGRFELQWKASGRPDRKRKDSPVQKVKYGCPRTENDFAGFERFPIREGTGEIAFTQRLCDLIVVGGGTAGAMAAIHAARGGLHTILLEPGYDLGGTGTLGGVSTYWFGCRFRDVREIDEAVERIYAEFGADLDAFPVRREGIWSGQDDFHAGLKGLALLEKCLEAGVEVRFGELAYGVFTEEESGGETRVTGVIAAAARSFETVTDSKASSAAYYADAVIDATGDGDIAVFAGADSVYGSGHDCLTYWGSLAQYQSAGSYQNNFASMLICADPVDYTRFIRLGRKRGVGLFDHGTYVSMRESRHISAVEQVTLKDLMIFRRWEDALYTCYSNYDPKGRTDADIVYAGVLPPQVKIQIPLSALLPVTVKAGKKRRISGLYVAGKAISATHNVFPSIRMQPDLMHQGAVLGALLAESRKKGTVPEKMDPQERRNFLLSYTDDPLTLPEWNADLSLALRKLRKDSRTHWVDVPFSYEETGQSEVLAVMTAKPEEVLPELERMYFETALATGETELQKLLAGMAIWHGTRDGRIRKEFCRSLEEEIRKACSRGSLPVRRASTMCAQLLPDHGVMPEACYRLNLAGRCDSSDILKLFEIVLAYLEGNPRDYITISRGIWHYIEAFAGAAQHSGIREFAPMLLRLAAFPELEEAVQASSQKELLSERLQILRLTLYRALAGLGEREGYRGLIRLLNAPGLPVRCSACMALRALSGRDYGLTAQQWERWAGEQTDFPRNPISRGKCW